MIRFTFLDKAQKDIWLPRLFDLYYENMHVIAPSDLSYDRQRQQWLDAVSPALEKAPREILLGIGSDGLLGYIQYYTRDSLLMIEEVQIVKPYQRTMLFYRLCWFLKEHLPEGILWVEAYADVRNEGSQKLMKKLGMVPVDEAGDGQFIHLRGEAGNLACFFSR